MGGALLTGGLLDAVQKQRSDSQIPLGGLHDGVANHFTRGKPRRPPGVAVAGYLAFAIDGYVPFAAVADQAPHHLYW
ncbi:MAG TPA: hypothetical protein VD969_04415 [Symbiobacteriaceae bacterium]|nr:hypothetical protein [Symbiobacteriaceae bacterium]